MTHLYALHGFLGLPDDWQMLRRLQNVYVHTPNLLTSSPTISLTSWGTTFNQETSGVNSQKFLLGYSLGGRLALHALIADPTQWSGAIIVSTHPGLTSDEARKQRQQQDQFWVNRFETDSWDGLMEDWNQQEVFHGSMHITRREEDYDRSLLSLAMKNWSLWNQENLIPCIAQIPIPILWVTGEQDKKAAIHLPFLKFRHAQSKIIPMPEAGHRAPWQQPQMFLDLCQEFIQHHSR